MVLVPTEAALRINDYYSTKTKAVITSVLTLQSNELVVGAEDNTIQICTSTTSSSCSYMEGNGHTARVTGLALTKNPLLFVSSSSDTNLIVWNSKTKKSTVRLEGHTDAVKGVVSLADGTVASCANDGDVKVWDVYTGTETRTITPQIARKCIAIAVSYDGSYLFASLEVMIMGQRNSMLYLFNTVTWTYKKMVR
jgi:WD40 repeat protein